jgi:hypothetical protein
MHVSDWVTESVNCSVKYRLSVISGFRRDADEICADLWYNAASSGNPLPTFRDNVSVPSSRVKKPKKTCSIRCPKTSLKDYRSTLCYTPEERRSQKYRLLKSSFLPLTVIIMTLDDS